MMMSVVVVGAIRVSIVLVVALVAYAAMARRSAAARSMVLVFALGAALVVPVAAAVGPRWHVEAPAAFSRVARESSLEGVASGVAPSEATASTPRTAVAAGRVAANTGIDLDLVTVLFAVWVSGAVALLGRAIASQLRARRLAVVGERIDLADGLDVRLCDGIDSPAVTGVVRPVLLLPRAARAWPARRMRVVLAHELAHVRRRDTLAQLVADAACALHWFNPLVWVVASRLRVERELAADDAVLASGVAASSYAEELLAVAGASTAGALAMAERGSLEQRVVAILAVRRARGPLARRGAALLVAGGVAVAVVAACASPEPAARVAADDLQTESTPTAAAGSTDPAAQSAAEEVLAAVATEWSAESAVVVVLDAGTGEVLADAGRVGDHAFDVARARAMPPGSTLKPITIAAALETGAITPTQLFETGPARDYGSAVLRDVGASGPLDAAHVLAVSSNVGTSYIFDALGGDRLGTWLARFHFAEAPLAGAATGAFPAMTTGTIDGAAVAIGEGMTATPLQMAAAYGVFASNGVYHAPTTVRSATSGEQLLSPTTASEVMAMLETAVTDPSATGTLARVDGVHVAGKTGTALVPDGNGGGEHTYASFIGIADLPAHRIVALVGVETRRDGASGGKVAAPAFARLVARLR
jgi:beta-lactamase regulating signal transducer with metallopeptidase domain